MTEMAAERITQALSAGVAAAREHGIAVCLCVVDAGGRRVGTVAMPGAFLASPDYAYWKAWTAAGYKMSTAALKALLAELPEDVSSQLLSHPHVTTLPGGAPVFDGETLIGAVSVSGGNAEQDEAIAAAAAAALTAK